MFALRFWLRTPRLALTLLACVAVSAFVLGLLFEARFYGISARDPLALLASAFFLLTMALLACWLPAGRAARTDHMTALRAE